MKYILSIDQSTSGTKALLFDGAGKLIGRTDLPHRQIIHSNGYVEHDGEEIYRNVIGSAKKLLQIPVSPRKALPPSASAISGRPPSSGRRPPAN